MARASARPLRVSENARFLVYADSHGTDSHGAEPFFYLGDTAWELFHRLNREDADHYLTTRAAQGFTVIQAVALAEMDGLREPNPYGEVPFHDLDPTHPNEAYFEHVDWVIDRAAELGLTIGLLPTWGDKWNMMWGQGPEVFTPENALTYAAWLARRYADRPIIWILGGDRPILTWPHVRIIRAMAEGIRSVAGNRQLISFHPKGQDTSSQYFHCDEWLDFNMYQTGHTFNRDNGKSIGQDYARTPIKPCMDAEPGYEDHPSGFKVENGWLDAYECRKFLYWALFAGAHGHTYGCHDIWQFLTPERPAKTWARTPWREALLLPGATQMHFAKDLLLSRPYLTRIPAQDMLGEHRGVDPATGVTVVRATRDSEGRYALIYSGDGRAFTVDLSALTGELHAAWFDPRTGETHPLASFPADGMKAFAPPTNGHDGDWVLCLDA